MITLSWIASEQWLSIVLFSGLLLIMYGMDIIDQKRQWSSILIFFQVLLIMYALEIIMIEVLSHLLSALFFQSTLFEVVAFCLVAWTSGTYILTAEWFLMEY